MPPIATKRQCVITGAGILSPLGRGLAASRQALHAGRSGIGPIHAFDAEGFPVQCVGEVTDPALPRDYRRQEAMALAALTEALVAAQLPTTVSPADSDPRRAVSFAIGKPTLDLEALARSRSLWAAHCDPAETLRQLPELERQRAAFDPAAVLRRLAAASGAGGPLYSSYTACASGNDAIGLGKRLIERNEADIVVAGATDAQVHPLSLLEFELLSALSHEPAACACRPFDRERTGFVVGEGAAVVILEEAEHARRRGVAALAELAGYGSSLDCYGLTKCHPAGRGAALAIRAALADAALAPRQVDYLNAHGTGTVLNDQAEAAAIGQVWGDDVRRLPVSSTKAMTGHLLTAASAVEAVITLIALREGLLPANLNYQHRDPDCDLNIVAVVGHAPLRVAMSNGFGFGGQNSSLILRLPASLSGTPGGTPGWGPRQIQRSDGSGRQGPRADASTSGTPGGTPGWGPRQIQRSDGSGRQGPRADASTSGTPGGTPGWGPRQIQRSDGSGRQGPRADASTSGTAGGTPGWGPRQIQRSDGSGLQGPRADASISGTPGGTPGWGPRQ